MPISDTTRTRGLHGLLVLFTCLTLAACQLTLPMAEGAESSRTKALDQAALDAGEVTVRGPAGYCIDPRSLRDRGARQFALLAQCDLLKSGQIEGVSTLSLLTVTAVRSDDDAPLPTAQQLADTFGPAEVLRQTDRDGVLLVQLSDGGQRVTRNADPVHWRGVMRVAGHTLGLAAYNNKGSGDSAFDGRDLLMALVANIRRATGNTATGDSVAVQKPS